MGGKIGVESTADKGSTFWFTVRLDKQTAESPTAVSGKSPDSQRQPDREAESEITIPEEKCIQGQCRVLIVEDNPTNQMVARHIVQKLGYLVDVADNGREAIDALRQEHFDAILMDIQMPVMGGIEATKVIRQMNSATAGIPIIAMTANAMQGDMEVCLQAGMDDYLAKPVDPDEIRALLAKWADPDSTGRSRAQAT